MYTLLCIAISLAFLLIVNLSVAVAANLVWGLAGNAAEELRPDTRAKIIFSLRALPVVAALVFVLLYVIPSYILHEPDLSGEVVSVKLAFIAGASSIGVMLSAARVLQTWLMTRRLISNWMSNATPVEFGVGNVPIYRIRHQFPVIAVIGILRPKIFIAESILDTLSRDEIEVAVRHEYGHMASRDNLKRTVLRFCSDLLIVPLGDRLDTAWSGNAELVADEFAAAGGKNAAVDLASALVKIARMASKAGPAIPAAAFLVDGRSNDISERVSRLLKMSEAEGRSTVKRSYVSPISLIWSAALLALLALPVFDGDTLTNTHAAVERFVTFLQ